ncbi:hypothetical protein WL29_22145 [Burkholderia ubonensis]|uniref:Uncharacterized protein n=1 Tax=Burkholderia ubonensis TaxID=101571 RepID=A0A106QBS0_9BURK|nr:hypothetical protein [Burkholderia ubonensis]KWA84070.1 hypothetical protein WL29_22145 [Burkholderia ubonensis]
MRIEDIKPDQVLQTWHDSGAMGPEPVYYKVLKVARVKIKVRCEYGQEGWMYPAAFVKIMRPDEVDWVQWR